MNNVVKLPVKEAAASASGLKPLAKCHGKQPAEMKRIVPRYSIKDEADLLWYHGLGQTCFERSTFGGMLDRAATFDTGNAHWPKCPVFNDNGDVIGHESAITARPTAETKEITGHAPDDEALIRYARVSKQMMRVERRDALASKVLEFLFGDLGARWATTEHGRNGALYHLTVKGIALIDTDNKRSSLQLPPDARIWSICTVNQKQPKQERSTALAVCRLQAAKLEMQARAVWHEVTAATNSSER